ncbi:MAG: serine/threonine-protein phosphatase [Rhodoferax sp.]|jgi:serine/threonine protein phosphatase PrpC|nr:serine/threonine-protein phosphatase [Rhodoferax sp.]
MKFSVFQVTRKGGRQLNEDRMGYSYTRASGILLLADGMGGHPEGEVAAQLALQAISALYQKQANPKIDDVQAFLTAAVMAAHRQIIKYAVDKGMLDTPRTTVVAALVQDGSASWVHCGDSRLYLVREGKLVTRTRDHSYMEQPPSSQSASRAAERLNRNILFTCLGSPTKPVFDIGGPVALQQGDKIMLCSDGLWGSLDDEDIVRQLSMKAVGAAVPDLVESALQKAGATSDNVTVIALEWESPDEFETTKGTVTSSDVSDSGFSSTVQAAQTAAADDDDLDDAAIERSIAEINEAIRRSASRRR